MMKSTTEVKKMTTVVVLGVAMSVGVAAGGSLGAKALSVGDGLMLNPVYEEYLDDVAMGRSWSIIPRKYVQSNTRGGQIKIGDNGLGEIPSAYSLLDEYSTEIKDQGADGTCWAYALATTMESTLRKSRNIDAIISPKQLDYLTSIGTPYSNYLVSKFGNDATHEVGGAYGGFEYASYVVTSRYAQVSAPDFFVRLKNNDSVSFDEYDSYNEYQNAVSMYMVFGRPFRVGMPPYSKTMPNDEIMGDKPQYIITDYTDLSTKTDGISAIKERILNNGAVYVETVGPGVGNCWDADKDTIVDKGINVCDVRDSEGNISLHALALVGWDDDYEYTDPISGEAKRGAFIGQNSWGKSDLFEGYNIDYDALMRYMVSIDMISESQVTEENKQKLQEEVENYNAYEYVNLAYDYEGSYANGGIIRFVSLDRIEDNNYKNIYDVTDTVDASGGTLGDEPNEEVFAFVANGNGAESIEGIAVGNHAVSTGIDAIYNVYVDLTGTGENYIKYGEATLPAGVYGQRMISSDGIFNINGDFKVKVVAYLSNGETLDYETTTTSGESISLVDYFTVNIYTQGTSEPEPDPEPEPEPDPEPEPEPEPDVPGTGLFTGDFKGAYLAVSIAMFAVGMGYAGYKIYVGRKEIFHRVKFDKK